MRYFNHYTDRHSYKTMRKSSTSISPVTIIKLPKCIITHLVNLAMIQTHHKHTLHDYPSRCQVSLSMKTMMERFGQCLGTYPIGIHKGYPISQGSSCIRFLGRQLKHPILYATYVRIPVLVIISEGRNESSSEC